LKDFVLKGVFLEHIMELIDRYLQAVKFSLPRAQRDDIIKELRDSILSQIEEKEAALGRQLTKDEQVELLKKLGSPMHLASRYGKQQHVIGATMFPIYWRVLKAALGLAFLVQAGASIVNDIAANRSDEHMWRLVAETQAGYVCMHMQGTPQTMQLQPVYGDVLNEVRQFFVDRFQRLKDCGVRNEQIIIDPGIGFGKNPEHNLQLLAGLSNLTKLGRPVLLGVSRKSFLGGLAGTGPDARLPAALACVSLAIAAGAQVIRAHDVKAAVETIRVTDAINAWSREITN